MKHFREIARPKTAEEAVALRRAAGTRALYLAGGTMVVPLAVRAVEMLVDISRLEPAELGRIEPADGEVTLGALVRLADLVHPRIKSGLPLVYEAASKCATPLVRNMATVGGALAVVHLPSDLALALLALNARVELIREGESAVALQDLLAAGWLKGHDLILRVKVPKPRPGEVQRFLKFGRSAIDIALVNMALTLELAPGSKIENLALAIGQSYSLPMVLKDVADGARGKPVSTSSIREIARQAAASLKPRSDFRASAEYRKRIAEVLVARGLADAALEAGAKLDA